MCLDGCQKMILGSTGPAPPHAVCVGSKHDAGQNWLNETMCTQWSDTVENQVLGEDKKIIFKELSCFYNSAFRVAYRKYDKIRKKCEGSQDQWTLGRSRTELKLL